jgi:F5/8 type C domain
MAMTTLRSTTRAWLAFVVCGLLLGAGSWPGCGGSAGQPPRVDESAADATADSGATDAGIPEAASPDGATCSKSFASRSTGTPVTLTVDPSSTKTTFVPQRVFGINSAYFIAPGDAWQTQPLVMAAGDYFIRYPGGSSSDDYHWNGTGSYDGAGHYLPSDSRFTPGFPGVEQFRGTTSTAYGTVANVTDGDPTTFWLSNTDTDFPDAQWVYVDLGSVQTATSVTVVWGTPYATSFRVQSWGGSLSYPPPYAKPSTGWNDTSAGAVVGTGGTQTVMFDPVSTEFVRLLLSGSSAGSGGPFAVSELTVANGATEWTHNVASTAQSPTTASSTDVASSPLSQSNFDFESFMKYVHAFTPSAVPVITVNVGTGTPSEAAAWVHYANVVKGYGIAYWQIGNEMEGNWETGGPLNAQDYVRRYAAYYQAMKAADPTITILGPVSGGMSEPSNLDDGNTFIQDFIGFLHARGLDTEIDGIDFHWYPNYGPVSWDTALASTSALGQFAGELSAWLAVAPSAQNVPVFMSEYNFGLGPNNVPPASADALVNGLWLADALGQYIGYFGGSGGGTNLWNNISSFPTSDVTDPAAGDLGYLQFNHDAYRFQPHANYWAMQMMAQDWATAGDPRKHRLVSSSSSQPLLAAYADQRPDGALSILVVNKDPARSFDGAIDLAHFAPAPIADVWTFDSSNYVWDTSSVPYHAQPDVGPTHAVYCGASSSIPFTFAPGSITVLRFVAADASSPDLPTPDASAESGRSADAGTSLLIDDMSDPSAARIRLPPQHPGDVSGSWYTYIGGGSSAADTGSITPAASRSFYYTSLGSGADSGIPPPPGYGDTARAACTSGETPAAQYAFAAEGFSFELSNMGGRYVAQYVDISSHAGLAFWVYNGLPTSTTIRVGVPDKESDPAGGICSNATDAANLNRCYSVPFEDLFVPTGWSLQKVPFNALLVNPYFGIQQPAGGDMTTATDVHFEITQDNPPAAPGGVPKAFDFCIAGIGFFD